MSVGPMGMASSITGGLPQARSADTDRTRQDLVGQARQSDSAQHAEAAAGIGQTEQEEQASDRDADGRRLWERTGSQSGGEDHNDSATSSATSAKDPTGQSGSNLDLTG